MPTSDRQEILMERHFGARLTRTDRFMVSYAIDLTDLTLVTGDRRWSSGFNPVGSAINRIQLNPNDPTFLV